MSKGEETDKVRIEYVRLSDIVGWPRNPKLHDSTGIELSIIEHGFNDPPALDENTGQLVEGHGRVDALRSMQADGDEPPDRVQVADDGEWLVPVLRGISFKNEEQAQAYLIAHNRLTEKGGWNEQELQVILQDLAEEGEGVLNASGYTMDELDQLTESLLGASSGVGGGGTPPDDFDDVDLDKDLDYQCPKCGYEWDGSPR